MSMLVPPQMINTMVAGVARRRDAAVGGSSPTRSTPTRSAATCCRCFATAVPTGRSHPYATRDSLHEHDMWVAEGLTHRYPTKVLAELLPTCPQYCGHCTRMDLVGNSTPQVAKLKFDLKPVDRYDHMIDYLRTHPGVRDVVVSGGDVANMPWKQPRVVRRAAARDREHPRHPARHQGADGPPPALAAGRGRGRHGAARRQPPASAGSSLAIHTHVNPAQSVTPLVAEATSGDARRRRARRTQPGRPDARRQRPRPSSCSTCASRCSTAPGSCRTTSTCAT